jgi:hypothetical protein
MKTFKSLAEVEAAGLPPPLHGVVHGVVKSFVEALAEHGAVYDPEDDGYAVLIEAGDTDADVEAEVGYGLREALFEGGLYEGGCFVTCTLHNNQFGISWVVPDQPWLDPAVRARLAAECGEEARK